MQLKAGAKAKQNPMGSLVQPVQMIPFKEKDDQWVGWCMDWFEWQGIRQLRRRAPKLLKYYKASKGIIDRSDYIKEEDNQMNDLLEVLETDTQNMLELRFYPLIPTIIDSFRTEFSKRQTKIMFQAVDPISTSEMELDKRDKLEQILLAQAELKMQEKLQAMGSDMEDPEVQKQLSPDVLKELPNLQQFYRTGYRNIYAEWAQHQKAVDDQRFHMDELEERGFVDKLVSDSEFWHFKMKEDDYEVELWNPLQTFYHKSPDRRWISQANWIGMIDLMTAADVVDKYGWVMTEEQLRAIEAIYPIRAVGYLLGNRQNDGSYYDATRSHDWNTQMPSLQYRQFISQYENISSNGDIVQEILLGSEDLQDFGNSNLLRVSTVYWKSQRKVGHLTKIDATGIPYMDIIDEGYKVVDKPIYDTTVYKEKTKYNLIFGEHIDWMWINDIWGGVKIGPNRPAWWGMNNPGGMQPMYIGITKNKPGRLPFQFKGDDNLYGVKLPVEGAVFGDRNTLSVPMVAKMMPSQIGYNLVCNQMADMLIDELGTVVMMDHNALPKHSLGEDWGPNNYQKAWVAMKNFQILPLDTSLQNMNGSHFNGYTSMDLSQTNRLVSRINFANFYEQQCYKIIGMNAQRMAQAIGQETSAKEYEESIRKSYDQTEMHFIEHCDYLMPRVHQMRTELAQYYQSKNPSVQLQYVTTNNEKVTFQMDGTNLLMRDINVFPTVKVNARQILQNLKQMLLTNNTTGATIFDLGKLMQIDNLADLNDSLGAIEQRTKRERQQELEQEQAQHEQLLEQEQALKDKEWEHEELLNEMDNQAKILIAQISSAGKAAQTDSPAASEGEYLKAQQLLQGQQQFTEQMNFDRQKHATETKLQEQNLKVQHEKVLAENMRTRSEMLQKRKESAKKPAPAKKK